MGIDGFDTFFFGEEGGVVGVGGGLGGDDVGYGCD